MAKKSVEHRPNRVEFTRQVRLLGSYPCAVVNDRRVRREIEDIDLQIQKEAIAAFLRTIRGKELTKRTLELQNQLAKIRIANEKFKQDVENLKTQLMIKGVTPEIIDEFVRLRKLKDNYR